MWFPVKLKIENLFSYESSEFDFRNNQLTLLLGSNKTDPNVMSNRSGKTSLLDCITISIIGEPLRDITKKEIVRNGESAGSTTLTLKNNVLNKELIIESQINATKSSKVLLWENGVLNDQLKDLEAKHTYQYIIKEIGISKDDLINYYLISKDSYQSFFLNGDTAKKEIINRFSKANLIDGVDPLITKDLKEIEVSLSDLNTQFSKNAGVLEHLEVELNDEKLNSSIEETRQKTIDALQEKHDVAKKLCDELPDKIEAQEELITKQDELHKVEQEKLAELELEVKNKKIDIETLEKVIQEIQVEERGVDDNYKPKFEEVQKKITECKNSIKENQEGIKECNKEIAQIDAVLAGQIECPKCDHKFILKDKEYNIESALEALGEYREAKEEFETSISSLESDIEKFDLEINDLNIKLDKEKEKFSKEKTKRKDQIKAIESDLTQLKKDVNTQSDKTAKEDKTLKDLVRGLGELDGKSEYFIGEMNNCISAIAKEKEKKYDDPTATHLEKIETLKSQQEELQSQIDEWIETKNLLTEWTIRFKQFKSFMANSSIASIEEMTNYFLQKMKTNLSVIINGYRELSNGKLKEEIETLVSRDGLNGERINKFSGEEKAEVNLAAILAFQKIINISSPSGGLNLLFIDEILESADQMALPAIVKALVDLEQTIFLITFIDMNIDCSKLQSEKIKGVTTLSYLN